jgi:hypothetical protein
MPLALLTSTLAAASTITASSRTINASTLHEANTLPFFGGYSGSQYSPTIPPIGGHNSCSARTT